LLQDVPEPDQTLELKGSVQGPGFRADLLDHRFVLRCEVVMFRLVPGVFLILCLVAPVLAHAEGCAVAYFKAQAMAIHNTQDRVAMTQSWLKENIPNCSPTQLKNILANSPIWLGTALTPKIAGLLEAAIEAKSGDDSSAVEKLLAPPERKTEQALAEVHSSAPRGQRNLTKPGAVTAVDNTELMSQAAVVAAAAATAAAIVQGGQPPGGPTPPPGPRR
jgi:hypothetical protein